tara:strand:- start:244 stop:660 length:417 start_codon:yes stop_codon:yes gene_type:complete
MSRLKPNQVRYTFTKSKVAEAFQWVAVGEGAEVKAALWLTDRFAGLTLYKEYWEGAPCNIAEVRSSAPKASSNVSDEMLLSAAMGWRSLDVSKELLEKAYRNESKLAVTVTIGRSKGGKCWDFEDIVFTTWRNEEVAK